MAKAGTINEIVSPEAIKQLDTLITGIEKATKGIVTFNENAKKGGTTSGGVADYNGQAASATKARKAVVELTDAQRQKIQADKEANKTKELTLRRDNEALSLYERLKANWELEKRHLKEVKLQYGENSKEAKLYQKSVDQLDGQIKRLDKSVGEHQKNVGNYSSALGKLRGAWIGVAGAVTGALAAFSGIIAIGKQAIQGAMEDERAERKLTLALDGNAKAAERLLRFKEKLMRTTLLGEDEIMQVINYGLAMGRTEVQTKQLAEAAISLSNASGGQLDVMGAMDQLNKTYAGDLGRLKKYTGELTKAQLENGDAIDIVLVKYGKFLSEGLQTTEGELIQAKKSWIEFWEDVGKGALKAFSAIRIGMGAYFELMGGGVKPGDKGVASMRQKIKDIQDNIAAMREGAKATDINTEKLKYQTEIVDKAEKSWLQLTEAFKKYTDAGGFGIPSGPTSTNVETPQVPFTTSKGMQMPGVTMEAIGNAPFSDISSIETTEMEKWNTRLQIASEFTAKLTALSDVYYQNELMHLDEEVARTQEAKDRELEAAGGNKRKEAEINKRYLAIEKQQAKERKKILHDQAVMAKAMSAIQSIVNTAVAVTAQMSIPGAGIGLAIVVAALGAIELATILAQQIPSYAKGTKSAKGGLSQVGEKGTEIVRTPTGEIFTTPDTATLMNIPAGSEIIPHDEWMRTAMRATLPGYVTTSTERKQDSDLMFGIFMLNETIKNKKEIHFSADERGFTTAVRSRNLWEEYLNKNVRL